MAIELNSPGIDVHSLSSPAEVLAALGRLEEEESAIDESLSQLVNDKASLDALLERIDSVQPLIDYVQHEANQLSGKVNETANVAERISGKVRLLDLEQSRVKDAIDMLQAVQDLKTSITALSGSIERRDWETATRNMQRAMAIDFAVITSGFAQAVVPTESIPTLPSETIDQYRSTLLNTFLREFETASSEKDEANTSRFFKLFPMIGCEDQGLDAYAKFVCNIVSSRTKNQPTQKANSPNYYVALLTPLFEQIALIVSQHQPVVEKYYGDGKMLRVATRLQFECDRQACTMLDNWVEDRKVARKLGETKLYRFPHLAMISSSLAAAANKRPYAVRQNSITALTSSPAAGEDEHIDPREVDSLLNEISSVSSRWQLYRRFLYSRLSVPETKPTSLRPPMPSPSPSTDLFSPPIKSPRTPGAALAPPSLPPVEEAAPIRLIEANLDMIETSEFHKDLLLQLRQSYQPLEAWYLRSSLEKAHLMDEADYVSKPHLSSALDDTFFILKKVLHRVGSTASIATYCNMCETIRHTMEEDFGEILRKRMDTLWLPLQNVSGAQRIKEEESARRRFIVYANDLDMAIEYLSRLLEEISDPAALSQVFFLESELAKAQDALRNLSTLENKFRSILNAGLEQLFNQLTRPKLRPLLADVYKDITYKLDEDAYNEADYQDLVRKRFSKAWESLIEPYRETMTPSNYDNFFTSTVTILVRLWESVIKSTRFTDYGAMKFDRDIRNIASLLSSQTSFGVGTVRDQFARLHQIASLLSVESVKDADDLASTSGWKLSQQETTAFLSLKV